MECALSLMQAQRILDLKGIPHDLFSLCKCACITTARNSLVARFLADAEATDLFFIDSDVGFDPAAVVKILECSESIVAGIYPLKRDEGGFPVTLRTRDGVPFGRDGLLEALFLPAGFMRIKRGVFDLLAESYPELKYEENVLEVEEGFDFFGMGAFGRRFRTEDYAFCQRWRDIKGTLWVYPDIDFQHIGMKAYAANYHEYLLKLPGGAKSDFKLTKALGGKDERVPEKASVWCGRRRYGERRERRGHPESGGLQRPQGSRGQACAEVKAEACAEVKAEAVKRAVGQLRGD